jgi:hypothetical protein
MKQQILAEISSKLSALGIPVQNGNGADITINTEFLDAGWSTGSKKISYEASIFANEQDNVVYMNEKTIEIGHGLSFGGGSGSSFQSGKMLFRKVKSVQYGLDGKSYEYTLDLGAIPKAVKETAKLYGWKFKTVIIKNKAMYPPGYVPPFIPPDEQVQPVEQSPKANGGFCSNCGMPLAEGAKFCDKCGKPGGAVSHQSAATPPAMPVEPQYEQQTQSQYNNPQGQFYSQAQQKSSGKGGTFGLIGFIILGLIFITMLAAGKATLAGWAISVIIFTAAFLIQRKLSKKGCLLNLVLWIITGFILLVVLTVVTTDNVSLTTAKLKNAHMTTAMDSSGKPIDKVSSYSVNAAQLVAVSELRNAPVNTKVKFVWKYITGGMLITEYSMDSGDNDANVYVFSNLTNDKPWPEGKYRVEMYVENRETPDASVDFEVTAAADKPSASKTSSQPMPANVHSAAFRIDYLSYGLWPGFTYRSDSGNDMNLGINGDITFSLNANPAVFSDPADKVSKITATVNLLKPPSFGTVKLYRFRTDLAVAPGRPIDMKTYGLPMTFDLAVTDNTSDSEKPENYLISFVNPINYGQVRIYYCIENFMPIAPSIASWMDSIPVEASKGITSDALRSNIGIELLITMKSGEKHRIYFEREMMQGDFFSKTRLNNIIEDYQGKETPIFSKKTA